MAIKTKDYKKAKTFVEKGSALAKLFEMCKYHENDSYSFAKESAKWEAFKEKWR